MPQNWKTYKLGEVVNLRKESIRPDQFNGENYIGLEHITQGTFLLDGLGNSGDVESNKYKFLDGDILYGKIRPYFKKAYRPKFSGICSTDILVIKTVNEEIVSQNYLYQIVKTQFFTDRAIETSSGTKMPRTDWNSLANVELTIPPLPEQQAIASILSSLDDKIELNLQMNKTLEEMAMTLYKQWFVDFEFPSSGGVAVGRGGRNTTNYMSLPYNPKLKERAKALRKAGNLAEVLFWQQVNKKQFMGLDFDRQKIIGNYIVDFYCANVNVVVEIDGRSHDNKQDYDAARDAYLESLGLTVIHITDEAVKKDLAVTIEDLKNHPAFQAPLQGRGRGSAEVKGYKSSGGRFIDSPLGPIPDGWEVKGILEVVDLLSGGTPKTTIDEYWNGEICWVSAKDIGNGVLYINDTEKKISELGVAKSATKILPEDTVILVARGSVGKYGMIASEMAMNQSCYGLYTKGEYSQGLVYLMFSKLIEQFQRMAYGSVFDTITTSTFRSTQIVVPPESIIKELKNKVDPLFDQLKNNTLENQTLTALRDTLLPKLISGEIRVKDAEKLVTEAV